MPTISFRELPTDEDDFFIWANAHATHHYDCIRVAGSLFTARFDQFPLDPFDPRSMEDWLEQHQLMHIQMNNQLSTSLQYDLSELSWEDLMQREAWITYNWTEHNNWSTILKVE